MAHVVAKKKNSASAPLSDEVLEVIAGRFKLLAEPARLKILHALQGGELTVTALIQKTGFGQANVSKHLALLAASGMVGRRREQAHVYYVITDPVVFEICEIVCERLAAGASQT